ncbi:MAG: hypothetical protein GC154_08295 [bacterium]|nr:hypothetical protein [bacterium]
MSPSPLHMRRIVTGMLFVPVFLVGIFWTYGAWFAAVVVFAFFVASRVELYALYDVRSCPNITIWQVACGLFFLLSVLLDPFFVMISAGLYFGGSCLLTIRRTYVNARGECAVHGLSLIYLLGPLACFVYLRSLEHGMAYLFFILAAGCITDVGGFYGGKFFGRHKMAPHLSPNKTWEGAAGGVILSLAFILASGWVVSRWTGYTLWLKGPHRYAELALTAAAMSIVGQAGDLFESALKRDAGVKDSGVSNTGHGGWLDILDGLLWIAPAMTAYVVWMK